MVWPTVVSAHSLRCEIGRFLGFFTPRSISCHQNVGNDYVINLINEKLIKKNNTAIELYGLGRFSWLEVIFQSLDLS